MEKESCTIRMVPEAVVFDVHTIKADMEDTQIQWQPGDLLLNSDEGCHLIFLLLP